MTEHPCGPPCMNMKSHQPPHSSRKRSFTLQLEVDVDKGGKMVFFFSGHSYLYRVVARRRPFDNLFFKRLEAIVHLLPA